MDQEQEIVVLTCECGETEAMHGVVQNHRQCLLPGCDCMEFRKKTTEDNSGKIVPFASGT